MIPKFSSKSMENIDDGAKLEFFTKPTTESSVMIIDQTALFFSCTTMLLSHRNIQTEAV